MSITKMFQGGKEVQDARDVVAELKTKEALGFDDQCKLDEASSVLMKWRAKLLGVAAVVAGIGGGGVYMSMDDKEVDPTNSVQVTSSVVPEMPVQSEKNEKVETREEQIERETDELIERMENTFRSMEGKIGTLVEQGIENPALQAQLMLPFQVMKINSHYPNKNVARFYRQIGSSTQTRYVEKQHPYQFMYVATDKLPAGIAAGYDPMTSKMAVSPEWDGENGHDFLVAYHELLHVSQFAVLLRSVQSESQYRTLTSFMDSRDGKRPRILIQYEVAAYACEIEMLNLLLNGAVKKAAENGQMLNVADVQKTLNLDQKDLSSVQAILKLGQIYYSSGGMSPVDNGTQLAASQEFFEQIVELYKQLGNDIYIGSPIDGTLKRIG